MEETMEQQPIPEGWTALGPGDPEPDFFTLRVIDVQGRTVCYTTEQVEVTALADSVGI